MGFGNVCRVKRIPLLRVFFVSIGKTRHVSAFCLEYFNQRFTVGETVGSDIVGYRRLASDDAGASEGFRCDDM